MKFDVFASYIVVRFYDFDTIDARKNKKGCCFFYFIENLYIFAN